MLRVHTILCRAGYMDNYSYLIIDEKTGTSAIIDASEVEPIVKKLNELKIKPDYILSTHHHFDHTDANLPLKEIYGCKIVGAEDRIPGIDIKIKDGKQFALGESVADIIDVSAHTQGHILYYFKKDKVLFTGDTLFNLCVGGLFEGTAEQMFQALAKIKALPDDVNFYPGHEYTLHGINDMLRINNSAVCQEYARNAKERLAKGLPVHPTPLGIEKQCNPYLLTTNPEDF